MSLIFPDKLLRDFPSEGPKLFLGSESSAFDLLFTVPTGAEHWGKPHKFKLECNRGEGARDGELGKFIQRLPIALRRINRRPCLSFPEWSYRTRDVWETGRPDIYREMPWKRYKVRMDQHWPGEKKWRGESCSIGLRTSNWWRLQRDEWEWFDVNVSVRVLEAVKIR